MHQSYESALDCLYSRAHACHESEDVDIFEALGRVISADVVSSEQLPSFDNSAMNGLAVWSGATMTATEEDPLLLSVQGRIISGDSPQTWDPTESARDEIPCFEIMTGAPLPISSDTSRPFDAVVKVEDTSLGSFCKEFKCTWLRRRITIHKPAKQLQNVRKAGDDVDLGSIVVKKGDIIRPEHLHALCSLGITHVRVFTSIKLGVISTGEELVSPSANIQNPSTYKRNGALIRDSNGPYLTRYFSEMPNVEAEQLDRVVTGAQRFRQVLIDTMQKAHHDIIVSTGVVSKGTEDYVPDVLASLGFTIHWHGVSMRPGHPILFAEKSVGNQSIHFFGLPGNPVAAIVGATFFIRPFIRALLHQPIDRPLQARFEGVHAINKPFGRREFYKARLRILNGQCQVILLPGQGSHMLSNLVDMNAWCVIEEDVTHVDIGDTVTVWPTAHGYT